MFSPGSIGVSGSSCGGSSEGESTNCFDFSEGGVFPHFLSLVLFSGEPEVGPSTGGSCGGPLSSGFLGGSLSVKGRVPTESWE